MTVQESNSELQKQPVARTRRRLSIASWILAIAIFVLWVLVAIPGETRNFIVQGAGFGMTREHGWPAVHYISEDWVFHPIPAGAARRPVWLDPQIKYEFRWAPDTSAFARGSWSNLNNWMYFGPNSNNSFFWVGAILNLLVMTSTIFIAISFSEYRSRLRGGLFRFRLWELMALLTLVAISFGWMIAKCKNSAQDHHFPRRSNR